MPTGTEDAQYATYRAEIEKLDGIIKAQTISFRKHQEEAMRVAADEIASLRAENERLRAVVDAARRMPRWTPKGGSASTMHIYQIKAADTWALDAALKALGGDEQKAPTDKEIEAAAKMLCYLNGIPECAGCHPDCGPPCTPETCEHGMRDFGGTAKAVLEAAERARHSYLK